MRTLVVHTGAIGDFILYLPALEALGKSTDIDLLGYPERLALAVEGGLARKAYHLDSIDFASIFSSPSNSLKTFLSRFDRAIVWMRDTAGNIADGLRTAGIGDVHCFPGLPDADWQGHAAAYYAHCLHGSPAPEFRLHLTPSPVALDVVIHPGSGSKTKNWPLERFIALAARLEADGHSITWCLGPAEEAMTLPAGASILRQASLVSLGRQLAHTALFIGNDSGISHLAAAVGCPSIVLFGPTNPAIWRPIGHSVWIVHRDELDMALSSM